MSNPNPTLIPEMNIARDEIIVFIGSNGQCIILDKIPIEESPGLVIMNLANSMRQAEINIALEAGGTVA